MRVELTSFSASSPNHTKTSTVELKSMEGEEVIQNGLCEKTLRRVPGWLNW